MDCKDSKQKYRLVKKIGEGISGKAFLVESLADKVCIY